MDNNLPNSNVKVDLAAKPAIAPKIEKSKFQRFLDSKKTRIIGTILLFIMAFLTALSLGYVVETIRSTGIEVSDVSRVFSEFISSFK
jgi:hypothetical protein